MQAMSVSVVTAVAAFGAFALSGLSIVINRKDRSNEWRRDAVIPPLREFLAAAIAADELTAAWQIGLMLGREPGPQDVQVQDQISGYLTAARAARIDLDLFTPKLGRLAAGVTSKLVAAAMRPTEDPMLDDVPPASMRPTAIAIEELERQARILCRLERRTTEDNLDSFRNRRRK